MNDKEFERLVERFNYNHKGVANANRTAFLEEGDWIDPKPMTLADMQFTETANLNRDTILLAYGASKFDVGVLEDVNRASANAASNNFGERMTVPRLDRWAGMLNNDFLPQFPGADGYEFVYCSPVQRDRTEDRADKLTSAQVFQILINSRVDAAQAAEVAGLPVLEVAPEPAPVVVAPPPQDPGTPVDPNADPAAEPVPA
jgi:phage portal protein BeeE